MSAQPQMSVRGFDRWYKRHYGVLYGPHYQWMREGMTGKRGPASRDGCLVGTRPRRVVKVSQRKVRSKRLGRPPKAQ